jgi:DNA-binding NtrC family response regulator
MAQLARAPVDLVLSDIYMPGEDGLSLLSRLREGSHPPKIVLMTARGTVETATIAARLGVTDYVAKPFDLAHLLGRIAAALAPPPAGGEPVDPDGPRSLIVGSHPAMVEVYNAVARVARLPVTVLVLGETGTGKELVARALHQFGAHPDGPFVAVHCGAIPDTLLESELFGHVRGAFTGADRDRRGALREAQHGTVFLDEIGDVSPSFQTKLLRFLQEKTVRPVGAERSEPVDVRVVAATHRDIAALSAAGSFRQDLYFRLAGYEVRLPALRDRLADLPLLVEHFRAGAVRELGLVEALPASPAVLAAFAAHSWPGNVRELEQVVRRLLIDTGALSDAAVAARLLASSGRAAAPPAQDAAAPVPPAAAAAAAGPAEALSSLDEVERRHILEVLSATGGNRSAAARILGIERKTLSRKLKAWGTADPDGDDPGSD